MRRATQIHPLGRLITGSWGSVGFGAILASAARMLAHERLDVYQISIRFVALSLRLLDALPKGHANVADQLRRASMSIPLNIAESSGKTSSADRKRFMAIARGSAMECGAILDVCRVLGVGDEHDIDEGKKLLVRMVSMLTKMCR